MRAGLSRTTHPRTHHEDSAPAAQPDAVRALRAVPTDRPAGPHLARQGDHRGAALALDRPARRQPGAHRPDEPGAEDDDVRPPGPDGLQGDRGRLPGGQRDRLRVRPPAHRERPDPRRRHHLGADPGPRGPHRAQRPVAGRRTPREHPPLQRAGAAVPPGRLPGEQRRDQGHRDPRHRDRPEEHRELPGRHGHRLRVQPRDLHLDRAALLARGVRGGLRRLAARGRPRDHPQPAGDGRVRDAERLRRPDRVVRPTADPAPEHRDQPAPAQRPRAPRSPRPSWP